MSEIEDVNEWPGLSTAECDALAIHFKEDRWIIEVGLMGSKWFDYRLMHPAEATWHYIAALEKAYRQRFAAEVDRARAEFIRFVKPRDLLLADPRRRTDAVTEELWSKRKNDVAGAWYGRQVADAMGMPYEVFTSLALENRMRFWRQRYMPRPSHLYSMEIVEKVAEKWEEMQTARLYVAKHPSYAAAAYCGMPWQDDHHEWLFAQAGRRQNASAIIARFLNEELLPEEKLATRFDAETVERIRSYI